MTIFALSTGPGLSGIAIVRVSGPETETVVKQITSLELPKNNVASFRKFFNKNNELDALSRINIDNL